AGADADWLRSLLARGSGLRKSFHARIARRAQAIEDSGDRLFQRQYRARLARMGRRIGPFHGQRRRDATHVSGMGSSGCAVRHAGAFQGVRANRGLAQAASDVGGNEGGSGRGRFGAGSSRTAASAHIPSSSPAIVHSATLLPRRSAMTAVRGASAKSTTIEVARIVAGGSRYPIRAKPEVRLNMLASVSIVLPDSRYSI